jgi:predicted dehydrogenase
MADKIRVALIGAGQIAKQHLRNYREIPDAEVVAVTDIREDEAQRVGRRIRHPQRLHRLSPE